uniref:RING-type domain-containing protein n=1 Tax=Mantoniella antarctica TaxID=81844 RepID=A0A7S0SZN5_9CHLO|mmetsp:Transcript_5795/g.14374  ORF Transcript_5795/g.14374 Transcript_5795/m.14374 type:complete len:547 (+) Transcript_5795:199-1839(+)
MVLRELGIRGTDAVFFHSTKRDRVVFVDEVPPGLICPVCDDVFVAPRIAPCGHSLCATCVEKVNKQTGKCFSCSASANPEDFTEDNVSGVQLGDLRVFCRNALGLRQVDDDDGSEGGASASKHGSGGLELFIRLEGFDHTACSAAVRLRELDTHEVTCEFRSLMCDLCDEEGEDEESRPPGKSAAQGGTSALLGADGGGGVCGFTCMTRDMPRHRATCTMRVTNCPFATSGCRWRGSAGRLPAHRASCRKQPRRCPNGCGAYVGVGPMMMRHLDTCSMGEVACDAPDAEERPGDPDPLRCPAVVQRGRLAEHRREQCPWARASKCRQCHVLVSQRSTGEHTSARCASNREPCPNQCGTLVATRELQRHLNQDCDKAVVECPYGPLGCGARTERSKMPGHLTHATGQHLELTRRGLVDAQRRGDELRRVVDSHRREMAAGVEAQRSEAAATLAAKESSIMQGVRELCAHDAEVRAHAAGEVEVLTRAADDQASTLGGQALDMIGALQPPRTCAASSTRSRGTRTVRYRRCGLRWRQTKARRRCSSRR